MLEITVAQRTKMRDTVLTQWLLKSADWSLGNIQNWSGKLSSASWGIICSGWMDYSRMKSFYRCYERGRCFRHLIFGTQLTFRQENNISVPVSGWTWMPQNLIRILENSSVSAHREVIDNTLVRFHKCMGTNILKLMCLPVNFIFLEVLSPTYGKVMEELRAQVGFEKRINKQLFI